jgi:hypothetical protein
LHPAVAPAALPEVDVELPVDRLARDLDLELLGGVGLVERAAAVRAGARQGRLVDLVDLFGPRRLAMGLGAVLLAGLAARPLGVWLGRPLGEGSGLALTSALGLIKLSAERLDLRLQVCEAALQRLAAATDHGPHTLMVAKDSGLQMCRSPNEDRLSLSWRR